MLQTRTSCEGKWVLSTIWSFVWGIVEGLLLAGLGAAGILLGVSALRDIRTGKTLSLNRMSTRVIERAANPTAFWFTIAACLVWGVLGAFFMAFTIMLLVGV
ncbi:hypothetical protein M8312_13165 [Sphingomonas sp. KRR8]|uniref:hypothetical protein n=1 Tax=Sphingomonas sp. KRR8 TaxID=2942996 RepID=UPI0020220822|nr:hypothetical protein [Sphingomonas sp. KRR8]URD60709.1 hypothetical protein M8312_13165 [Sphingomonas sp. KRR8]